MFNRIPSHGNKLRMHLVSFYRFAFHRFECPCPYVECHLFTFDASRVDIGQYLWSKMQSGRRGSYRPFDLRVNGLVGLQVALLRLAVQIGRNGQYACGIQYLGKGERSIIPCQFNYMAISLAGNTFWLEIRSAVSFTSFPFIGITRTSFPSFHFFRFPMRHVHRHRSVCWKISA